MKRARIGMVVAVGVVLAGCGTFDKGKLDPRVASQVTMSKLEPPAGCEFKGSVKGAAPFGDLADANSDALRRAVLQGGNYISVDLVERPTFLGMGGYEVQGRLFTCPTNPAAPPSVAMPRVEPAPAPALAAPTQRGCDPECASGYTCQMGVCISARPGN